MADGSKTLSYAVRPRVVWHYLSQLALMLGLLALVPLGVSVIHGESTFALRYGVVVASLVVLAVPGLRARGPARIQLNEAMVVVSMAFVVTPFIMTFPLTAGGLAVIDTFFEAVSGITTTGLSTAGSTADRSPVFLFARSWMQWYGGLGIAALSVALLMGHHGAARGLVQPPERDNLATTARIQARQVLSVYLALTLIGVPALWLVIGDGFAAVLLMLSTVSTGGFSPSENSLADLPAAAAWIISLFSLLGAVPLLLYFYALRQGPGVLLRDPEVRALALMVTAVCGLLALYFVVVEGWGLGRAMESGVLLGVAAQTTSGFSSMAVSSLDAPAKLGLMASMVIGGGVGSSAGGIKLLRLLVVIRLLQYFLRATTLPPHALSAPVLAGRTLEPQDVERVLLVLSLFLGVAVLSWLVFLLYGYPPLDALFEIVSALGTVGLSTGIARPDLEAVLKLVLCADMLLGRLELVALLVLLYPRTWIGKRA